MVTERKTPANDDAGTTDTNNARNRVLRARIGRIAFAPCFSAAQQRLRIKLAGQAAGMICINAMPRIMLLAGHRKVTSGNPTVLRVTTMCVGGYPTFAARGPAESRQNRKLGSFLTTDPGCPISRSFFARCGMPLPYPCDLSEFASSLKANGQDSSHPTSREKRARYGAPRIRGQWGIP